MVETNSFTTPSGYRVTTKVDITYGEFLSIQKMMAAGSKFDPATKSVVGVDTSSLIDYLPKLFETYIIEVQMPDGTKSENIIGSIKDMPRKDGVLIQNEILAIFTNEGLKKNPKP